jgi:uncharacterized protein with FMN-binding domain
MRRSLAIAVSLTALALPVAKQAAAAERAAKSVKAKTVIRKVTGRMYQADRWGGVQVVVTVKKTTRPGSKKVTVEYTDLGGQYTYHTSRSQYIMSQALPLLRQEFLQTQSLNIQNISGATYTSEAFYQSLQSALKKL